MSKSIGSYFFLIWTQLFPRPSTTFLSVLTVSGPKAQPTPADETFRRRMLRYLFGVKTLMIALMGALGVAVAQAAQSGHGNTITWALWATIGCVALVLGGAIWLGVTTDRAARGSEAAGWTDRMDDRYWKLGGIYANPNDSAIFVERRFGPWLDDQRWQPTRAGGADRHSGATACLRRVQLVGGGEIAAGDQRWPIWCFPVY